MTTPLIVEAINNVLLTTPTPACPGGETLVDMLNEHLCQIVKQSERIADALEAILEAMPGP